MFELTYNFTRAILRKNIKNKKNVFGNEKN